MLGRIQSSRATSFALVVLLTLSVFAQIVPSPSVLEDVSDARESNNVAYDLYFASAPGGHPTDGRITTERPDSGGQDEESASGTNVEFSTDQMLSDLIVSGTPNSNQFELEVVLFLKATGQEGSTVEWSVSIIAGTSIIATEDWETDVCTPSGSPFSGGDSCGFDERYFHPSWNGNPDFDVEAGERLKVVVSADMNCNSGGGDTPDTPNGTDDGTSGRQWGGNGVDCDAWVAWNEIDSASGRFSKIEIETQPMAGSEVKVQRPGSVWTDGEVETWFPNDSPDMRVMQFNVQLQDAFGREDIEEARLVLIKPDTSIAFSHTFDDNELVTDNNALRAQYNWSYPGGLDSGDYELDLEIQNIQGKSFTVNHPTIRMSDYGVALTHGNDRVVEYIAPGATTPVNLDLRHVGASGSSYNLSVELAVLTNLGSNWIVEFDRADRLYGLSGGGQTAHPTLLLTAPSDLSGSPDTLQIRAVAYDSESVLVHQTILQLDLEKLDTYAPPMASLWPEAHDVQYANSTGALDIDEGIHRYVEDGVYTTFYLEIFNTGFDTDQFRIDIKQDSNANLRFWDNDTGQRIEEDEGDGTFHTSSLDRHTTQTIRLQVKPSTSRDDPDSGLIELEIISIGNSTQKARIAFTIQRTYGIQAEIVYDCDSSPFGHVNAQVCLNSDDVLEFDFKVTNTMTEGDTVTDWLIMNPKDLDRNIDDELYPEANPKYGLWQYDITDSNGDPTPRVQLAPGDTVLVNLDVTLTSQVVEGNHTIYLRIREDISDASLARYFDLSFTIEIAKSQPLLSIHQISQSYPLEPGDVSEIQMKVKNDGNSEVLVLLDADSSGDWDASVISQSGAQVVTIPAFSEISFTVTIVAGETALNGDEMPITVSAKPLSEDESYPDSLTAKKTVTMQVSINDPIGIIMNELQNPRPATLAIGLGVIILLVVAISGRRGRVEYIDVWVDEDEEQIEEELDLPEPVTEDDDSYDEDDIELVDLD